MAGVERTIEGPMMVDTTIPDSALTREQIIARNLKVVEAHFHNETPSMSKEQSPFTATQLAGRPPRAAS